MNGLKINMEAEGQVRHELMAEYLHPIPENHLQMFEALKDEIERLMVQLQIK